MKILHYIPTYAPAWTWGGPVVSTASLCEELAAVGHQVTVYTSTAGLESMSAPVEIIRNGVRVYYYLRKAGIGIHCPGMEQAVHASVQTFDIVHVTGVWQRTSRAACAAAAVAGVAYVISPRGALGPYSWRQKSLKKMIYFLLKERRNLSAASGFHFTSLMEAAECERFTRRRPHCVIPNGFVTEKWRRDEASGSAWRERHRIASSVRLLVSVGRIHHKKGLDLLPEALARVAVSHWHLVFVGDDNDGTQNRLKAAFDRRGMGNRVLFLSSQPREELPTIYSAADLFVLPSRHENFGNVVVEALACGCPAVISDQVGFGGEAAACAAVKILPRDPVAWARGIGDYLNSDWQPPPADEISLWAHHHFSSRKLAIAMADFYNEVITYFYAKRPPSVQ